LFPGLTNEQVDLPLNFVRLDGLLVKGDQQVKLQLLPPILAGGHRPLKGHTQLNVCHQKREESVQEMQFFMLSVNANK
jgi:hypothetical protein